MKPIYKLNGGNVVTLCHCCRKIISTDALYCSEKCEAKHRAKILMNLKK